MLYTEDYPPYNWRDKASGQASRLSAGLYPLNEMGIADMKPVLGFIHFDMYLACLYARYGYEKDVPRFDGTQK